MGIQSLRTSEYLGQSAASQPLDQTIAAAQAAITATATGQAASAFEASPVEGDSPLSVTLHATGFFSGASAFEPVFEVPPYIQEARAAAARYATFSAAADLSPTTDEVSLLTPLPPFEIESQIYYKTEVAKEAINWLMQSAHIQALFREAYQATQSEEPFKIVFVERKDGDFNGYCDFCGRIRLMSDLLWDPAKLMAIFTFELTNAKRTSCFLKVSDAAAKGEFSKEDYSRRYEEIEFENVKSHLIVCRKACSELNCPTSYMQSIEELYPLRLENFETYWEAIKDGAHAEFYRKNYAQLSAIATERTPPRCQ